MNRFMPLYLLLGCLFLYILPINAQEDNASPWMLIRLKDKSNIIGKLTAEQGNSFTIASIEKGTLKVDRKRIRAIQPLEQSKWVKGQYWHENQSSSRSFIGPTGFGVEQGTFSYQNIMLLFHQFNIGITDYFSLGAGFELGSVLADLDQEQTVQVPGFSISPKFHFPMVPDKFYAGVGAFLVHDPNSERFLEGGVIYGIGTFGNKDRHFSTGMGFWFSEGQITQNPLLHLSGSYRFSRKVAVILENWALVGEEGLFSSFGLRLIGEKLIWDFAFPLLTTSDDQFFSAIPLVGFQIPLGRTF